MVGRLHPEVVEGREMVSEVITGIVIVVLVCGFGLGFIKSIRSGK